MSNRVRIEPFHYDLAYYFYQELGIILHSILVLLLLPFKLIQDLHWFMKLYNGATPTDFFLFQIPVLISFLITYSFVVEQIAFHIIMISQVRKISNSKGSRLFLELFFPCLSYLVYIRTFFRNRKNLSGQKITTLGIIVHSLKESIKILFVVSILGIFNASYSVFNYKVYVTPFHYQVLPFKDQELQNQLYIFLSDYWIGLAIIGSIFVFISLVSLAIIFMIKRKIQRIQNTS